MNTKSKNIHVTVEGIFFFKIVLTLPRKFPKVLYILVTGSEKENSLLVGGVTLREIYEILLNDKYNNV